MKLHYKNCSAEVKYSAATDGFYGEITQNNFSLASPIFSFQVSEYRDIESVFREIVDQQLLTVNDAPVLV